MTLFSDLELIKKIYLQKKIVLMIKKEKWRRSDSNPTSSFKAFSFSVELFSVALSKKK